MLLQLLSPATTTESLACDREMTGEHPCSCAQLLGYRQTWPQIHCSRQNWENIFLLCWTLNFILYQNNGHSQRWFELQPLRQHCSEIQVSDLGRYTSQFLPQHCHIQYQWYSLNLTAFNREKRARKTPMYFSFMLNRKIKYWRDLTWVPGSQVSQLGMNRAEWGKQAKAYLCTSAGEDSTSPEAPRCRWEWDPACNLSKAWFVNSFCFWHQQIYSLKDNCDRLSSWLKKFMQLKREGWDS